MKASLVIACYNEEQNIIPFLTLCQQTFSGYHAVDFEYIFVNDGSRDQTASVIKQVIADFSNVDITGIDLSRNFGKEAAMLAGLDHATGDFVTVIDADLQQHPKYVLTMLDILLENDTYDSVACYQAKRKDSIVLSFFKTNFYRVINRMSETEFSMNTSDFRTFRRSVVEAIKSVREYHRFSKGIFSWVGYHTKYMPYEVSERLSGKTSWSLFKLAKYAKTGIIGFSTAPLKLATYLGGTIMSVSFLYLVYVIVEKLLNKTTLPGYTTIISLILFLSGVQIFLIGIIGEYLAHVFIQVKNRPIYIVKSIQQTHQTVEEK